MENHKAKKVGFVALLLIVASVLPFLLRNQYSVHVLTVILMWAYFACAWNIIGGFAGQLSLGHGLYVAIGGYISTLLFNELHLSPLIGMWVGAVVSAIIAILIGFPTFSLRGAYYALATVAVAEGVRIIIENTIKLGSWHIGGAEGLTVRLLGDAPLYLQFRSTVPYYYMILLMLVIIVLFSRWLCKSKLGYYLVAQRENEEGAMALGINVRKVKLIAAGWSAFFTALGGTFYSLLFRYLEPNTVAGAAMSNQMVFLAIVGGCGTVFGPVIGGIVLTLISEIIRVSLGGSELMGLHLFVYGLIVVLTIIFEPRGLIGVAERLRKKLTELEFLGNLGYLRGEGTSHEADK